MSSFIPSTLRSHSQFQADIKTDTDAETETSSLVSSPSVSEQSSASEDGSEKSMQAPVMKTRQASDATPVTTATHTTNGSVPAQANMMSSSPTVKNRPTGEQRRSRYGQARNLPTYKRDTNIVKIKATKQGNAENMQQAPEPDGRWDKFTKAVNADGQLTMEVFDKNGRFDQNEVSECVAWLRTSPSSLREIHFDAANKHTSEDIDFLFSLDTGLVHFYAQRLAHAIEVEEALRDNKTLIKLKFSNYFLSQEGVARIVDALRFNTTIAELGFAGIYIDEWSAEVIASVLKVNTTLTELSFSGKDISDEGAKVLLEALRVNQTLTSLSFSCTEEGIDIQVRDLLERNKQIKRLKLTPYAEASLDLLVRHSPALQNMGVPADVIPVLAEQLSLEVLSVFAQDWEKVFRAPPPPITTTTTNTTTTTTTTEVTTATTLTTSPAALATNPASEIPVNAQPIATAANINALLADPKPVVALSRWIDHQPSLAAALNWVDPANGYTLLHYAVAAQQGAVIRNLLARGIDRTRTDHNNQTAAQLAQQRRDSSSSQVASTIAAMFQ